MHWQFDHEPTLPGREDGQHKFVSFREKRRISSAAGLRCRAHKAYAYLSGELNQDSPMHERYSVIIFSTRLARRSKNGYLKTCFIPLLLRYVDRYGS